MKHWHGLVSIGAAIALLAGCGGSGDSAPIRGGVTKVEAFGSFTKAQIDTANAAAGSASLTGAAICDVIVQRLQYQTKAPGDVDATASTAVLVPAGTDPRCTGARPVVLYAHGTTTSKAFNMANIAETSNGSAFLMALFAAQGFIVVAPNYLGYDTSSLNYHPYLNAEASAIDMIDAMRATRAYLQTSSVTRPASAIFITGYSQGGHVAMATHKVMQRDYATEFVVAASGPMSGPYNLVTLSDAGVLPTPPQINAGATIFLPLLTTSYQRSYGNIYANPSEIYQAPFAATIEGLLPSTTPVDQLIAQGKLPADPTFTKLYGAGGLITDAFRTGYRTSAYRRALVTNTLIGNDALAATPAAGTISWTPKSPVAMCGGAQDPTVFFAPNGPVAVQIWRAASLAVPYVSYNLEDRTTLPTGAAGDALFAGFQAAKTAAGANAVAQYHGSLVPPFCHTLVRGFFYQVLAAATP